MASSQAQQLPFALYLSLLLARSSSPLALATHSHRTQLLLSQQGEGDYSWLVLNSIMHIIICISDVAAYA